MARFSRRAWVAPLALAAIGLGAGCTQSMDERDRATLTNLEASVNATREEARAARATAERAQMAADQAARAAQVAADRAEQASRRSEEANERANRMFQYNLRK